MNLLTLDFETFFDNDYTLSKLTTEAYVRDPRFAVHGCGFLFSDGGLDYVEGHEVSRFLYGLGDWGATAVLAHHAHFDGLILSHHYGIRPAFWLDTMGMARMVLGPTRSVALAALQKTFGLRTEKSVPYERVKGVRPENMSEELRRELEEGCLDDCRITRELFHQLAQGFPEEELRIIDMTVRWFTEPQVVGDVKHYEWLKEKEWVTKNEMLYELGVSEKELGSNERLRGLLEAEGVEIDWKDGKNGKIHAFAKSDAFMQEMLDHENPRVAQLVEARLAIKSTIDETRAGRLAAMAQRGRLPIYLNYCGAGNTLRWSGGDHVNWQNFRRAGELRKGLVAPDHCLFGTVDKSQVECRFLNYLAGETDAVERFRTGEDPYLPIASKFYGRPITKANAAERGMGKQLILSCGYGAGGASIVATAKRGSYGPPVALTQEQGQAAAHLYRSTHPRVVDFWAEAETVLAMLFNRSERHRPWKGVVEIHDDRIIGPNGSYIIYQLEKDLDGEVYRKVRHGRQKIWGGVLVQNLMEFLCRIDLAQGLLRLKSMGINSAATIHDEAWFVHPASEAAARHEACLVELARSPDWLPDIPLAVEGNLGDRYEK
jgi:hypothetical protein